jgi:hypothetical protein
VYKLLQNAKGSNNEDNNLHFSRLNNFESIGLRTMNNNLEPHIGSIARSTSNNKSRQCSNNGRNTIRMQSELRERELSGVILEDRFNKGGRLSNFQEGKIASVGRIPRSDHFCT